MNLFQWMGRFSQVLERPFAIGWTAHTLKCMLGSLLLYGCGLALYYSSRENRRPGEEYGSAKWGNPKELNRKYMDHQHKDANIILTQRVRLGIVKLLGKETIATRTRGQTKGRSGSSSTNFQQTGRDLMTIDEVRKLDTHKAILFIRGEDPVLDKKYNIKRHPNIKLTTDGKAKPYIHKPQGAPDYALPDLPYAFRSLDDYDFIDVEEPEHELSEKEKDFKPDKTE